MIPIQWKVPFPSNVARLRSTISALHWTKLLFGKVVSGSISAFISGWWQNITLLLLMKCEHLISTVQTIWNQYFDLSLRLMHNGGMTSLWVALTMHWAKKSCFKSDLLNPTQVVSEVLDSSLILQFYLGQDRNRFYISLLSLLLWRNLLLMLFLLKLIFCGDTSFSVFGIDEVVSLLFEAQNIFSSWFKEEEDMSLLLVCE